MTFDPVLAFSWSVVAGFMMAMGAGGGIVAGVGHFTVLGIQDANMIKVVNQILEFTSRLVAVPLYHRQHRVVGSVALCFALGALFGAVVGAWLSRHHLADMSRYRPLFGLLVVAVALWMLFENWRGRKRSESGPVDHSPPRTVHWSWLRAQVHAGSWRFEFSPPLAVAGGFAVSFLGSLLGVSGGFLAMPFLTSVLLLPALLSVGTGLVALMLPLTASVLTYLALDVRVDWLLVAVEVPGVLLGSIAAPLLNQRMNERMLKTFVATVLLGLGTHYVIA